MTFTVATYNVLASAYISPERYPNTPRSLLAAERRIPALIRHVGGLAADLLCLQEVEDETFEAIEKDLAPLGYSGHYAKKGNGKPDGCATFYRKNAFELVNVARVEYRDGAEGGENSGHVAQIVLFWKDGRHLGVANTHLKWDPPGTPREQQYGYRQIRQLLQARDLHAPPGSAWIICGDFNAKPSSFVVAALQAEGLEFTHHEQQGAFTCNANQQPKMIDFIFHNAALHSWVEALPLIDDRTPLPGLQQPSDHLAVVARFDYQGVVTGPKAHWAYHFRCDSSMLGILSILNEAGPWSWQQRESAWYGDYLCIWKGPMEGVSIRFYENPLACETNIDNKYPGANYSVVLAIDAASSAEKSEVDGVLRNLLATINGVIITETEPWD